jgi:hypothetical protein
VKSKDSPELESPCTDWVCIPFLDEIPVDGDLAEEVDGIKPEVLPVFCLIGTLLPVRDDSDTGSFSFRGRPGFRLSDSDPDIVSMFGLEGRLVGFD